MFVTSQSQNTNGISGLDHHTTKTPNSTLVGTESHHHNSHSADKVTISVQAAQLSANYQQTNSQQKNDVDTLPAKPELPNKGEKVDNYLEFRKAKAQYQIYSDMAGVATGNNNGMSASTAYYLSTNDDARATVVNSKAQQQQMSAMQTYVETTQNIHE